MFYGINIYVCLHRYWHARRLVHRPPMPADAVYLGIKFRKINILEQTVRLGIWRAVKKGCERLKNRPLPIDFISQTV